MVANVSRAWHRTQGADGRPLYVRHSELVDALVRIGSNGIFPVTENSVDAMQAELTQRKKPVVEVDEERLRCAQIDLNDEIAGHTQLREKIIKEQYRLEPISDEHRLLGTFVNTALLKKPLETQRVVDALWPGQPRQEGYRLPGEIVRPKFSTVDEYRDARVMMARENDKLRDILADIGKIWQHDAMPMSDRNRKMIWSLYSRIGALEDRIGYLETIVATKPKQRKAS